MTPNEPPSESARPRNRADSDGEGFVAWWFRDRRTGALVIAQFPNPALWVWIVCWGLQAFGSLTGDAALLVQGAGRAALLVWALDEIARGCNPFRRVLGAAVLLVVVPGWVADVL